MAYSPHTWQAGETVTAANMNRVEDGIEECKSDLEDVAADISQLKEDIADIDALSDDVKNALLDCFEHVAWIDNQGQTYYNALEEALYPRELASISAVFDAQGATIYTENTLDDLRQFFTVTATYDDSSTEVITDYTLSGSIVGGTSTITIGYEGKTTTVNISVTDLHTTWQFSVEDNNLVIRQGGTGGVNIDGKLVPVTLAYITSVPRYSVYTEQGILPFRNRVTQEFDEGKYLFPIPTGATKVTANITPSGQYYAVRTWEFINGDYEQVTSGDWTVSGTAVELSNNATFMGINLKYDNAGTTYPDPPTEVVLTFE